MPSLQQMCRAAWSLAARTNVSGGAQLVDTFLTSPAVRSAAAVRSATAIPSLVAAQPWQQLRAVSTIIPLSRTFHGSSLRQEEASVNPLQQTPAPLSARIPVDGETSARDGNEALTARAILRNVAISPQKLNDFTRILRGLHIEDALIQCQVHPKKSAQICEKVLLSARANAVNNHGLVASKLKVEEAWVGKGQYIKRVAMHGRGRAGVKHKYRSHLTIILKEEETKLRTRVLPMMQERKKFWDMREGKPAGDNKWWRWWGQKHSPPGAQVAAAQPE